MRALPLLAAMLLAAAWPAPPAAAVEDDPLVLRVNPFERGLEGWSQEGSEKAFTWESMETSLTFKGQSGKEPPRLLYTKVAWDRLSLAMQVRSGTRKVSVVLVPVPDGEPVRLEIPRNAVKSGKWGDVSLEVGGGKAELRAQDGDEEEVLAAADLPADRTFRIGFEAPSGASGMVSNVRLVRKYENTPQVCEEGFVPLFDGETLGAWTPMNPGMAPIFRVEKGLLVGEVRTEEAGLLVLRAQPCREWEMRMRALWTTNFLMIRALEVAGHDGKINQFDSVQVNLTDNLDPEDVNDIVIRMAGGKCVITVNGKTVMDGKVKEDAPPTPPILIVGRGKRFHLRDIRVRDLAPGAGGGAFGLPEERPPVREEPKVEEAPAVRWQGSGGFLEKDGQWSVEEAPREGAGLLCGSSTASYEMRFLVARGAEGLSVVPRANRGLERSAGIRLPEALFEKEEWTEVVVRMKLLTCTVFVADEKAGGIETDNAMGPPALRVTPLGKARIKDLEFTPLR